MAKGSKRLRKKKQKQQQIQVIKQSGYSGNVNKLSNAEIQKQYTQIIQQNERKEKAYKQAKKRRRANKKQLDYERTQKKFALEKVSGIPMDRWDRNAVSNAKIDRISLKDIENGNFSIADFPGIYNENAIDFYKEHPVPDGKRIYFAFRALNGEIDISEELQMYSKYSNTELINNLKTLKNKSLTGTRNKKGSKGKNIGSSGKAGEGQVSLLSPNSFQSIYNENYNANRRANTHAKKLSKNAQKKGISFQHSGIDYHWQYISQSFDGNRATGYSEISIRKLLIIGNVVMDNIREDDRKGWYEKYRDICITCIPIMEKILP